MVKPVAKPSEKAKIRDMIMMSLHIGKQHATTGKDMAQKVGHRDDRVIRNEIEDMIREGIVILASESGYYRPANEAEIDEYLGILRSRATKIFERINAIEHATGRKGARPGQMALM